MFIDKARIYVKSGDGGKGCLSFYRAKFIPKGGPDGGDGGKGGNIFLVGTKDINTLFFFRHNKKFIAQNGQPGEGKDRKGKNGEDIYIQLPLGTVCSLSNGEIIEMTNESTIQILGGGYGGIGNGRLASSFEQYPRRVIEPALGHDLFIDLQLKLIGDVGLVGKPNAGKSSFICSCTNSKSVIASYEFTTLEPSLGTYEDIIIVDIPGLIEGASYGKGLGLTFLNHIERCKLLLFIIDISDNPVQTYEMIKNELDAFGITDKPLFIALNKCELVKKKERLLIFKDFQSRLNKQTPVFLTSTKYKLGIKYVLNQITQYIHKCA